MRKSCFTLLAVVLLIPAATLAQERSWFVGLKGGATLPSVLQTNEAFTGVDLDTEQILRYTGGLAVQYFIEGNFGLQVELNYAQRGWRQRFRLLSGEGDPNKRYEVLLDYAEVPIMAHAYLGRKNLRLFLNAGVYVAYLLSDETNQFGIGDEEITLLYDPRFRNRVDFGVRGGGGFEVVTAIGMFQAEGSFSWGINSIIDKNLAEIPNIVQNLAPAVTLGYYVMF